MIASIGQQSGSFNGLPANIHMDEEVMHPYAWNSSGTKIQCESDGGVRWIGDEVKQIQHLVRERNKIERGELKSK